MNICVFGAGYVGLVQAAVLANVGHNVLCIETDADKRALLQRGEVPIFEPGLEGLVQVNCKEGRLRFSGEIKDAVQHAGIQLLAHPRMPRATRTFLLSMMWHVGLRGKR